MLRIFDNMRKTKKEQKRLEEASIKDIDSSSSFITFFDKIKAMNKFLVYLNFTLIIIGYVFSLSLFFYMLY